MILKIKLEWKQIVGFEGFYSVSENGDIRREITKYSRKQRILKPRLSKKGYHHFWLFMNGKGYHITAHKAVAITFISPRPNGLQINHIDGNKINNHYRNLEYITGHLNILHAIKLGKMNPARGSKQGSSRFNEIEISAIRRFHKYSNRSHKYISNMFGVTRPTISYILRNETWRHVC